MEPKIELVSVWEDDDIFEIKITALNGWFSGAASCYTTREEMENLAALVEGFPKSPDQVLDFTTGGNNNLSCFSMRFGCIDAMGHLLVRVRIVGEATLSNTLRANNIVEFDLETEASFIDSFASALLNLSRASLGQVTAVLRGNTSSR